VDNNPLKYIDPTGHGVDTITCMAVAFLLHLSFVFASDDGSATIGVRTFSAYLLG
jgi:hypothetical protein